MTSKIPGGRPWLYINLSQVGQVAGIPKSKGLTTQMPIDVWIDSSNLVRRVQLAFSEPLPNTGQTVPIAMTENFLQYGPQPVPAIPSASESANLLSLLHGSS